MEAQVGKPRKDNFFLFHIFCDGRNWPKLSKMEAKIVPKIMKNHAPDGLRKTCPKKYEKSEIFESPGPS